VVIVEGFSQFFLPFPSLPAGHSMNADSISGMSGTIAVSSEPLAGKIINRKEHKEHKARFEI
jgi:hypothetical protein